jgi:hypothetical protein
LKKSLELKVKEGLITEEYAAKEIQKLTTEKLKEYQLQQAIELQKKAMADEKKTQDLQMKYVMPVIVDSLRNYYGRGTDALNFSRSNRRSSGSNNNFGFEDPYIISPGIEYAFSYGHGGDSERTTWDFSKQVKETSFSRNYSFDVEESASTVVMSVMGDCRSGSIRVKILMPGGKVYSDIVIDEFGNLNWRKSFTISEEENKDKAGEWKFFIDAEKATGYFKISLQTY